MNFENAVNHGDTAGTARVVSFDGFDVLALFFRRPPRGGFALPAVSPWLKLEFFRINTSAKESAIAE